MWHKIWDTASSFHERYIRPVWIRVHYSRLQEIVDDDGDLEEEIYINGVGDRSHITANNSQLVRYGSTCINNKFTSTTSTTFPNSLENEDFDQVDAGFFRPTITFPILETTALENGDTTQDDSLYPTDTKGSSSSCLKNSNSTVTDFKHAIQFPSSKRPPYRLVQEEADRIEIISIDNSSSKRVDNDGDYRKLNNHLLQHHQSKKSNNNTSSQQNNVEEILQSSSVVAKKSKSRRKKAFKHMKKIAGWTWKSLKRGFYAAPTFIISPQPEASIYAMATKYKAYFG